MGSIVLMLLNQSIIFAFLVLSIFARHLGEVRVTVVMEDRTLTVTDWLSAGYGVILGEDDCSRRGVTMMTSLGEMKDDTCTARTVLLVTHTDLVSAHYDDRSRRNER